MAITMDLTDPMLVENFKAFQELRSLGIFTDGELQKLYDEQVQKDKERMKGEWRLQKALAEKAVGE